MTSRTAACTCGQLSIEVSGEPQFVCICSCLACQRRSGSVFATIASFAAPFTVHGQATEFVRAGDGGTAFRFYFCPRCGTTVYHQEMDEHDGVGVAVGAFADPHFPPPTHALHARRRHPWVGLPDSVQAYDTDPP